MTPTIGTGSSSTDYSATSESVAMTNVCDGTAQLSLQDQPLPITTLESRVSRLTRAIDTEETSQLQKTLNDIYYYLTHPTAVLNAVSVGGIQRFRLLHQNTLLRCALKAAKITGLSWSDIEKINRGFTLLVQIYKIRSAYRAIFKGVKFRNFEQKSIQAISKANIQWLKLQLTQEGFGLGFGLRHDEIDLFSTLLNLPFRLQHATDQYYPILSSGQLLSYREIQRNDPTYKSEFSTSGNIKQLGNGGFVFFRVFIDGTNGEKTRYGDTSVVTHMHLLRKCGWISLHDQLKPFSTPGARRLFWGKRLLRKAEEGSSGNLIYHYRVPWVESYAGAKDVQKRFGPDQEIASRHRVAHFSREIFYGEDIVLGIALSAIFELRQLEQCGFRAGFLKAFTENDETYRCSLLGQLIKGFFRIEGKYPVSVPLSYSGNDYENVYYKPFANTDNIRRCDRRLDVKNPDGKCHYNPDMTINQEALKFLETSKRVKELKDYYGPIRKLQRSKRDPDKLEQLQKELQTAEAIVEGNKTVRAGLIASLEQYGVSKDQVPEKLSTHTLLLINDHLLPLLEEEVISFEELSFLPYERLSYISSEESLDLLLDGDMNIDEIIELKIGHCKDFFQTDIKKPLSEGFSLSEISKLHDEDPIHLECLTGNPYEMIATSMSDFAVGKNSVKRASIVRMHAENSGIDINHARDVAYAEMTSTERSFFDANIVCISDEEPYYSDE